MLGRWQAGLLLKQSVTICDVRTQAVDDDEEDSDDEDMPPLETAK